MGAIAQLSESTVEVEPGRSKTITLTVRNNGTVVDRYTFEALGAIASAVTFAPTSLSLFPEASGTVNIIVSPARDPLVPAGPTPLGVRVLSAEDPAGSVVEETTIVIGAFSDVTAELVPRIARGRRSARAQLAVDNRSNCGYRADLSASDPKAFLAFAFSPSVIDVPPGQAVFAKVLLRPPSHFWKGAEKTHSFRVTLRDLAAAQPTAGTASLAGTGAPGGTPPTGPTPTVAGGPPASSIGLPVRIPSPHKDEITVDGTMLQAPLLPRWLLAAVAALVVLAAILAILFFTVLKPQIRSTAQAEVSKQLAANGITSTSPTGGSSTSPSGGGSGSGGSGSGSSTAVTTPGSSSASSASSTGLTVNGSLLAVGNGTRSYTVPSGKTLEITDILIENSAGDTGNLTVDRSGTPLMEWSMANFRDLDYHWITPTVFGPGSQLQIVVSGCTGACTPGIYYAGHLVG